MLTPRWPLAACGPALLAACATAKPDAAVPMCVAPAASLAPPPTSAPTPALASATPPATPTPPAAAPATALATAPATAPTLATAPAAGPATATAPPPDPTLASALDTPPRPSASPRILLADEPPFTGSIARRHDPASPAHHHRHGRHGRPYHPAPGIIVDVTDASGRSAVETQRVARNLGYWPLRHCYEDALRRDQALAGKVSLDLAVNASGVVERASVSKATLHDENAAACLARQALKLPLPSGGAPGVVKIDVSLSTGDEPVAAPRIVPRAGVLRDALRGPWDGVQHCYAAGLADRPDVGGEMDLNFRVRRDGQTAQVVEVAEGDAHFEDSMVTRCVVALYQGMTLPAFPGAPSASSTSFVYALHFESMPEASPEPAATAAR